MRGRDSCTGLQSTSLHLCRAALREKGLKQVQRGLVTAGHEHGCPRYGFLSVCPQGADTHRGVTDFHFCEHRHICLAPLQMLTCPQV